MHPSVTNILALALQVTAVLGRAYPDAKLIDPVSRFSNLSLTLPPASPFPVLQSSLETPPDCGESSYQGRGRLQGLKALITGGDSGIGRAVVLAYLREGASIVINYLEEEEEDAQDLVDFVADEGFSIERIPGDLRNETFCSELVKNAHKQLGGLDILVANAGYSGVSSGPNAPNITTMTTAEIERTFETNLYANVWLARAAVPILPPGGSIIYTSSGTVSSPSADALEYGASKAALTYFMRCLAIQVAPLGIRVNAVAPYLTYTPLLPAIGLTTEDLQGFGEMVAPLGRLEQPVELSPLYVDLAAPDHTYVSGEVYSSKGGDLGF